MIRGMEEAKEAAIEVLRRNIRGPFGGLPRGARWGYPEPYTRDLLISSLGILASRDDTLISALRRVLETLAHNQTPHGHIPSLVHDPEDRGASDTTPLFLISVALFRRVTGERHFLEEAVSRARTWMDYRSPDDRIMVVQQPTSDWRDEQWVPGYGLYVNTLVYAYLRLFKETRKASVLRHLMTRLVITAERKPSHVREGLVVRKKPYFALWTYKIYSNERFDLLGNSLAVLSGLASPSRARSLIHWTESACAELRKREELAFDLPPCLIPYITPQDSDWRGRYETYNRPGEYHNGGVWPFICSFYVVAVLAAGFPGLARRKMAALTSLVRQSRRANLPFGFNEWFRAQDAEPCGHDWQTWSAAMYLYAATSVEKGRPLFFEKLRRR